MTYPIPSFPSPAVQEFQALYGPFSFPEKLLQKIWLRGEFDRGSATTADARRVDIVHPGRLNLLRGPDFLGGRFRLGDGPEVVGDVEVHLYARDWGAHGHARDAAYRDVALHVVLFPPMAGHRTAGAGGRDIPTLALLPLLHRDLEEIAADDAMESLSGARQSILSEGLEGLEPDDLAARLRIHAARRWETKMRFARLRIERLGWEEACHHTSLEIMGYRFNRSPMLRLAERFPLVCWGRRQVTADRAFTMENPSWNFHGMHAANHPLRRLAQYVEWTRAVPDWPSRLEAWGSHLPVVDPILTTREVRRRFDLAGLRSGLAGVVRGPVLASRRFNNLVCDGFLPLLGASGKPLSGLWLHWFAGDVPEDVMLELRRLGNCGGSGKALSNGLVQGCLALSAGRQGVCLNGLDPLDPAD